MSDELLVAKPALATADHQARLLQTIAPAALAIVDYGLAAETLELGAQEHMT